MPFSSTRVRRSSNTVGGAWTVSVTPQADPWTERNRPPHVPVCFPGQFNKPSETLDTKNRAVRLASLVVAFLPESASAAAIFVPSDKKQRHFTCNILQFCFAFFYLQSTAPRGSNERRDQQRHGLLPAMPNQSDLWVSPIPLSPLDFFELATTCILCHSFLSTQQCPGESSQ